MPYILSAYDITILYLMGTATMDTYRILVKERRDKLILLETVLQILSPSRLLNINQTSDSIMTEGCGQINMEIDNFHAVLFVCQAPYLRNEA